MKKKILFVLLLALFIPCSIFFAACGKDKSPNTDNKSVVNVLDLPFMEDMVAQIDNSVAFGIKHADLDLPSANGASTIDVQVNSEEKDGKYFLYKTTETYQNGVAEVEGSAITKVTFKKNTEVTTDVYDQNDNLISSDRVVTQDEIPAQINRLYTTEKFMFMQFVPVVEKSGSYNYYLDGQLKSETITLRPASLMYNENGISDFDTGNYYSSNLVQSFIVDLSNGYIYKISDIKIAKIHDVDIVIDDMNNYYKIKINENGNLIFDNIMPNREVEIFGVVTDKYGYTFVCNNSIDNFDADKKIVYQTSNDYMISSDKQVYSISQEQMYAYYKLQSKIINGNQSVPLTDEDRAYDLKFIHAGLSSQTPYAYYKGYNIYQNCGFLTIKLVSDLLEYDSNHVSTYIYWFDDNLNMLYAYVDNHIYYKNVDLDEIIANQTAQTYTIEDFTLLSDGILQKISYTVKVGNDNMLINGVYALQSLNETHYYKLVCNNGTLQLEEIGNKQYSNNSIILQAINK